MKGDDKLILTLLAAASVVPLVGMSFLSCDGDSAHEARATDSQDADSLEEGEEPEDNSGTGGDGGTEEEGSGGSTDPDAPEGSCEIPEFEEPPAVPIVFQQTVDLTARGGDVPPGTYVVQQAFRQEEEGTSGQQEYIMRFDLLEGGKGYYTRQLGFRVRSSKIIWSTEGTTFTYETVCPDTLESLSFGYTYDPNQGLILIMPDSTLLVLDTP